MRFIFKQGEGSPTSQISLGDGLKSLEEGAELKNNIVNTPNSDMSLRSNNGPLIEIRFLDVGGGRRYVDE